MSARPKTDLARPDVEPSAGVTVTVVTVGGQPTIVCSPDPVVVKSPARPMAFRLNAPGYVFRDEHAIVVSHPGTEFPRPSNTSPDGQRATLWNRDSEKASYKYSVFLKDTASGRILFVDPTIQNDPD